jgi:hypothetical protein
MTTSIQQRSFFDAVIREPLDLAKAQPHQILLSTGSIALMGQFAGSSGVIHPLIGYLIAGGVEWAYLRGLASDSRAPTIWGAILNWSAFLIVVLWGVLWVAGFTGAIDPHQGGWLLAAAHVVPIAWLSLCSAQAHRAAMIAERKTDVQREQARIEYERAAAEAQRLFEIEQAAKDRELERWKNAYAHKQALKMPAQNASKKMRGDAHPESMDAGEKFCPKCQAVLAHPQWLAARRWGHCSNCKEV